MTPFYETINDYLSSHRSPAIADYCANPSPVIVHSFALPPVPLERLYERVANLHAACVEEWGLDSPEARQTGLQAEALGRLVTAVDKQAAAETAQVGHGAE